jgi:hypothetical protein
MLPSKIRMDMGYPRVVVLRLSYRALEPSNGSHPTLRHLHKGVLIRFFVIVFYMHPTNIKLKTQ